MKHTFYATNDPLLRGATVHSEARQLETSKSEQFVRHQRQTGTLFTRPHDCTPPRPRAEKTAAQTFLRWKYKNYRFRTERQTKNRRNRCRTETLVVFDTT